MENELITSAENEEALETLSRFVGNPTSAKQDVSAKTIQIWKEAMRKQIAAEPKEEVINGFAVRVADAHCPECGRFVHAALKYCPECGQRLDWTKYGHKEEKPTKEEKRELTFNNPRLKSWDCNR